MTGIVIADDEPLLRFYLQKALEDVWPEADVLAGAANGDEALALIEELKPEVAFLDIHMPGLTGLEVALKINQSLPETIIVFLTAYDEYAVEAFERGALDYLLKPLDENRLSQTIKRIERSLKTDQPQPKDDAQIEALLSIVNSQSSSPHLSWFNALKGDDIHVVHVDDVSCLKAEDKYTTLYAKGREYLIRQSIKQLEEQLNPEVFLRIHRNALVNIRHVARVEKTLNGQLNLYLTDRTEPLAVSRAKQHLFKAH